MYAGIRFWFRTVADLFHENVSDVFRSLFHTHPNFIT